MTDSDPSHEIKCYHCGNPNIVQSTPVVPLEVLEDLIEERLSVVKEADEKGHHNYAEGNADCIDELQTLIEDYE